MAEVRPEDYLAGAVGELGMTWGHLQRAMVYLTRSKRQDMAEHVKDLGGCARLVSQLEDHIKAQYREASGYPGSGK
ncbi:MAG: hypothetical protein M3075_09580 [Candidatus Dormibacteraeota bacterium]|jgi:hypothetical protein|nr:hypothetical protein [Candidatus Dormibacteraeota bacterium]